MPPMPAHQRVGMGGSWLARKAEMPVKFGSLPRMAQAISIAAALGSTFFGLLAVRAATAQEAAPAPDALQLMQQQIDALKAQNEHQAGEIQQLRTDRGEQWLTEQRAEQIRGVVSDVLADTATRSSLQASGAVAGYDKAFFIASADGNFKLHIRGQLQVRFAFNNVPTAAAAFRKIFRSPDFGYTLARVAWPMVRTKCT